MSTKNKILISAGGATFTAIFLVSEMLFYLSFLAADLLFKNQNMTSANLKLIAIFTCFVFRVLLYKYHRQDMSHSITLAILFTFIADYFFLRTVHLFMGILFFTLVQAFYRLYLRGNKGIGDFFMMLCGFTMGVLTMKLVFAFPVLPLTILLPIFYFLFLLYNNFTSWREMAQSGKLFSLGLLLLLLCDIQVGLNGLSQYLHINTTKISFLTTINFSAGIWFFYLPSQICILFSDIIQRFKRADKNKTAEV